MIVIWDIGSIYAKFEWSDCLCDKKVYFLGSFESLPIKRRNLLSSLFNTGSVSYVCVYECLLSEIESQYWGETCTTRRVETGVELELGARILSTPVSSLLKIIENVIKMISVVLKLIANIVFKKI